MPFVWYLNDAFYVVYLNVKRDNIILELEELSRI